MLQGKTRPHGVAVVMALVLLAITFVACGKPGETGAGAEPGVRVGLLLPDSRVARWGKFDRPLIEKKIKELCSTCTMDYGNARGDVATQQQQMDSMITKDVDVLILGPVDAKALSSSVDRAHDADIPVVSYDRLAEGPISAYASFDGEEVGRLQGEELLKGMGDKADGGQIVMVNGDVVADPNAVSFKQGALSVLQNKVKIGKTYDVQAYLPETAYADVSGAIGALGANNIDGVYAANDGLAAGVISALKASLVAPLPPVTGQDAELAALQRIITGDQYMTIYKPFKSEADAAAALALALGRGDNLDDIAKDEINSSSGQETPAVLLTPVSVTVENIKDTVIKDGMYTIDQLCTPRFASACEKAGLLN
ncbi:sugar ABC transporter substrate-binding protein [Streptomyces sp. NPDC020681]|uniref:sugar ABC transporter substrate-binding protein n=1 Tax=Streptomyces sp. NPDC020681 TaxID=3365083 RepID=UPI0037A3B929